MPFGVEYTQTLDSFSFGVTYIVYFFIFFFAFTYFALRGKPKGTINSLNITLITLLATMLLVYFEIPPVITTILSIVIYLLTAAWISKQSESQFITTTIMVYINVTILQSIPDWLLIPYTVIILFYFFAKSENDIHKNVPLNQAYQ